MILLAAVIMLGLAALLIDAGNRVFGSYVRTPSGVLLRIVLLTLAAMIYLIPAAVWYVEPDGPAQTTAGVVSAVLALVFVVHFAAPYRWRITRTTASEQVCRLLVPGIDMVDITMDIQATPDGVDGITCLVLADLHCNSAEAITRLDSAMKEIAHRDPPDLVLLMGDFGERHDLLPDVIRTATQIRGKRGTFAVLGNHDFEQGREPVICDLLQENGAVLLTNEYRQIAQLDLWLLGLNYPWRFHPPAWAPEGSPFLIGLAHSPDAILQLGRQRVNLAFAGHTHGGKFRLPLFGAVLVPSRLGRFLSEGWFQFGQTHLLVTRGLGYFPGRGGQSGHIIRLTIRHAPSDTP